MNSGNYTTNWILVIILFVIGVIVGNIYYTQNQEFVLQQAQLQEQKQEFAQQQSLQQAQLQEQQQQNNDVELRPNN